MYNNWFQIKRTKKIMKTTLWKPCDLENTDKTEQILSKDLVEIKWFQKGGNFLDPEIQKKNRPGK